MNALQQFEDFVERLFEGSLTRLFRSSVQPAEVARRIERAMEHQLTAGVGRVYAPNYFQVRLNPADFKAFEPYRAKLEREMAGFVRDAAQEHGWELRAAPRVTIAGNAEVARRNIDVDARMADAAVAAPAAIDSSAYQPTAAMPIVRADASAPAGPRAAAVPPAQPAAALQLVSGAQAGTIVRLTTPLVTLGRELDNDVVVEDSRVSRHHAQILFQHNRYAIRDLDSTNHTFVNGQAVATSVLAHGDRISLGGFELQFMQ